MTDRTPFDDLARRKLEEREFPFDEAAWRAMEAQLPEPAKRTGRRWAVGGVLLLLLGTATWWATRVNTDAIGNRDGNRTDVVPLQAAMPKSDNVEASHARTSLASTPEAERASQTSVATAGTSSAMAKADATIGSPHTAAAPSERMRSIGGDRGEPLQAPVVTSSHERRTAAKVDPIVRTEGHVSAVPGASKKEDAAVPPSAPTTSTIATGPEQGEEGTSVRSADATTSPAKTDAIGDGTSARPAVAPTAGTERMATNTPEGNIATTAADSTTAGTTTDTARTTTTADSTLAKAPVVQDSTQAAVPTAQLPMLVDPRARWEITALGGAFLSHTQYGGERARTWESDVRGERSEGFGAELMHMGPHIGVGVGMNYGTYAERIDARALSTTRTFVFASNYFVAVDTTILVIVGTTHINDQDYYIVDARDTTLHILVQGTANGSETALRRAALQRVNTLSYLELPLLFDAHAYHGHWMFGVRGGPTLGVLQGRRGVLPNAPLDGYTGLEEEGFRDLVLGYSARVYVRFRLSTAWSIGIEPTVRGQLSNSLGTAELTRRSSAVGGQLSLTYRLP